MGYFTMLAAIPGFFLSSFFFMLLWGVIAPKLGWQGIDYPMAMLITITLWIAVAPLAAAAGRVGSGMRRWSRHSS
ncbi:MAG: hypothetical protein MUO97_03025 [Dehalococcoidia bacterium]|nr:hypothetical protein [Dehalococcoidia bacterium]